MISLNDATVYIEAGHSCETGIHMLCIPLSESPSLFSSLSFSLSFPFARTYGNPRAIVSPSFEKLVTMPVRLFLRGRKQPINSIQYFALLPPGIF